MEVAQNDIAKGRSPESRYSENRSAENALAGNRSSAGRKQGVPGILLAAPASGSGKTAVSCALMAAFQKKGLAVKACKCGPDYIDPMFHREVLGVDSENLDLFFSDEDTLEKIPGQISRRTPELLFTQAVIVKKNHSRGRQHCSPLNRRQKAHQSSGQSRPYKKHNPDSGLVGAVLKCPEKSAVFRRRKGYH